MNQKIYLLLVVVMGMEVADRMAAYKKTPRFAVGDSVKVRKPEDILKTLDEDSTLEGCLMTEQMYGCCGNTFKILKVVRNFFDEYEYRMYESVPTVYILDDLICDGRTHEFDNRCDRSCFLLWHEEWLEEAI